MFTVKVVHASGNSAMYLARSVSTHAGKPSEGDGPVYWPDGVRMVTFEKEDGGVITVNTGVVYVMNDMGKTIDKYRMPDAFVIPDEVIEQAMKNAKGKAERILKPDEDKHPEDEPWDDETINKAVTANGG